MGIVNCIFEHPLRERTSAPVRFLRSLRQLYLEVSLDQRGQAEFADAEQARRDDRVEDSSRGKIPTPAQQPEIEIGAMQDNLFRLQSSAQWCKIDIGQWVNDVVAPGQAKLHQAKLLAIGMKTVGFGVDRHALNWFNLLEQIGQLTASGNERHRQ